MAAAAVIESNPGLPKELSVHPAIEARRLLDQGGPRTLSNPDDLSVWCIVNSELQDLKNEHHRFWWRRGIALAILLHNAGYAADLQYRDLKFFAQVVVPHLGISQEISGDTTLRWPSFMTDNGNPIELSWDWGTDDKSPMIRYSIEPIGLHAGTAIDPRNLKAGPSLHTQLVQSLPDIRQEWYLHFLEFFNSLDGEGLDAIQDIADHNSTIFYAFDLSPKEITAKVYFFPKFRAQLQNTSNLDVLSEAISSAPGSSGENLGAWAAFHEFASEPHNRTLEHEMLSIDLIDPLKSRLKVYFRCRETNFDAVIDIMTLGGRIDDPMLYRGLIDLSRLWNLLFDVDDPTLDEPLRECSHRTAGILYNIEFRLGDKFPAAKIYMPVRHYSRSDDAIMRALDKYFRPRRRGKYMDAYVKTMRMLFSEESLRARPGVQTYVGASIRPDGKLRVVSYFKSDMVGTWPDA